MSDYDHHKAEAERLAIQAKGSRNDNPAIPKLLGAAQVHATLALAAASYEAAQPAARRHENVFEFAERISKGERP